MMAGGLLLLLAVLLLPEDLTSETQNGIVSFIAHNTDSYSNLGYLDEVNNYYFHLGNNSRTKRAGSCGSKKFTCTDASCIDLEKLCNGLLDCKDGSDETPKACRNAHCPEYVWRCAYGACVNKDVVCNGVMDCVDGSDEDGCNGSTPRINNCGKGKFQCNDGACIDVVELCNGTPDCPDRSDETARECATVHCDDFLFQCDYGACLDDDKRCNNVIDCADGSDENRVECPGSVPTATAPPVTVTSKPTPVTRKPTKPTLVTTPPTRVPSVDGSCVVPRAPEYGRFVANQYFSGREGDLISAGLTLEVICRPNYSLVGNQYIKCSTSGGRFESEMPECKRKCRALKSTTATLSCSLYTRPVNCSGMQEHETIVQATCKQGHTDPQYPNNPDRISLRPNQCEDGIWQYPNPKCSPICGETPGRGVGMVLGGAEAVRGLIPWHAVIYQINENETSGYIQICGGTIVNNFFVVSAGHCFYDDNRKRLRDTVNYAVGLGKLKRNFDDDTNPYVQKIAVSNIIVPNFYKGDATNQQSDIALLQLEEEISFSQYVMPICTEFDQRRETELFDSGTAVGRVAGMGLTSEGGNASTELRYVDLPVVGLERCQNQVPSSFLKYLTNDKFCAGYLNGTNVCSGDSGGGLVFNMTVLYTTRWYLRGIVSTGVPSAVYGAESCRNDTYSAFTRVTSHYDWIDRTLTDYT